MSRAEFDPARKGARICRLARPKANAKEHRCAGRRDRASVVPAPEARGSACRYAVNSAPRDDPCPPVRLDNHAEIVAYHRHLPPVEEAPAIAIVVPDRRFVLGELPAVLDRGPFSQLKRVFLRHLIVRRASGGLSIFSSRLLRVVHLPNHAIEQLGHGRLTRRQSSGAIMPW